MIDQKRENLLNLALAATEVERRRVPELSAGYNSYSKTWEVIVQYQGDLAFLEGQGVRVTLLLFSYAILLVPESLMDYVTGLPQITYLEKPKPLFFADAFMRSISCITPVQEGISGLYGNGVLLACIDSGVDYAHPDFCAPDGTSRIAILWDQTIPGKQAASREQETLRNPTLPQNQITPEETGDTPDDTLGALTGGTYTNKTARITCTLDDSWLFYNESQLLELNGVLTEGGSGDIATLAESGKAVYDMYAISTDGLMTMNVTYQNLGLLSGSSMSAQEYVELAAAKVPGDLTAGGFTDVEVQVTATDIAGEKSCPTLLVTAKLGETPMYERMVCLQAGNYIYCVTLCSFTEDVTPTMAGLFHTAG